MRENPLVDNGQLPNVIALDPANPFDPPANPSNQI
jgi:hypothetical protein